MTSELLLGFMTASWLFTIGAGIYVVKQYVYRPWQACQKMYLEQAARLAKLESEQELRKVLTPDNETLYRRELQAQARKWLTDDNG